jgi:ribonuclease VapC
MVIDSSAVVAILRDEAERTHFIQLIDGASRRIISAPALIEMTLVMASSYREDMLVKLDAFIARAEIDIIPFTADHAAFARDAFLRYGKGRHRAGLNFGDCIAYATARLEAMPLLFKGDDFRLTDIEAAA